MARTTLEKIFDCIDSSNSFILDAGAGSGKTWSLVESIKYVTQKQEDKLQENNQKIVCITYTNVAKNEIIERIENNELVIVNTIHDFLWSCISQFKTELKLALLKLIDTKIIKLNHKLEKAKSKTTKTYLENLAKKEKLDDTKNQLIATSNETQYKSYVSYKNNIVSHDEIIELAKKIFTLYPMIKKLISDMYPIIFVDEYQDTFPDVINILLDELYPTNKILFGFYGDKMQKIYDKGIGEISSSYGLRNITKSENYRCSVSVVDLLNKIRDDIQQIPSGKNQEVTGSCSFYQSSRANFDINNFIESELSTPFNLANDLENLKVLYLTHRLISKESHYEELYEIVNRFGKEDSLTKKDLDRCPFIKFSYQIEEILSLYQNNNIQSLLKTITYEINTFEDKKNLQQIFNDLIAKRDTDSIEDIIEYVIENRLLQKTTKMSDFDLEDEKNKEYYDLLMKVDYNLIAKANIVADKKTPYSTKHGTKGSEFENVLVVIDDTAWRNYNFDKYFSNDTSNESVYNRTRNLFYVVCSRAENNLVILSLSDVSTTSNNKIIDFFGAIRNAD